MSDGAHQGIGADRALATILGGKDAPTEVEQENRASVRDRVMSAPGPSSGLPPSDYGKAADAIAKAFLLVHADRPEVPLTDSALWAAVKDRWPDFDQWLGGASGFMVGWAVNCVRWLSEKPPVPNPALIEIP